MFRRTGIWLSVIFLGIAGAAAAEPEWTNIGPAGQVIRSIGLVLADHPNRSPARVILYAGTSESGVFRSSDQGTNWIAVNNGLTDLRIKALAVRQREVPSRAPITRYETVIYAITDARVFRSLDGGARWTAVDADVALFLHMPYRVNALATDPAGNVFVGTSLGAFKSSDGGDSWLPIDRGKGLPSWALAVDPRPPVTVYANLDKKLLKSVDAGETWTDFLPLPWPGMGFAGHAFFSDPFSSTMYVTAYLFSGWQELWDGVQYRSTDGGDSWNLFHEIYFEDVVFPDASTALAAVSVGSYAKDVARSTDGGKTWQRTYAGFPSSEAYAELKLVLDPISPGTVYAATAQGVFRRGPAPGAGLPRVVPKRQDLSSPVADR